MKRIREEDLMNMVAGQMAKKFLAALQNISSEKNYYSYVGNLAEILEWAKDFCELHYEGFIETRVSASVHNNYHNDVVLESLITSFGRQKLLAFYKQNVSTTNYFIEKYASLQG
jgi:hypothetical protein